MTLGGLLVALVALAGQTPSSSYLSWTPAQVQQIGRTARVTGSVRAGQGLIHTERAYRYNLRATWMTADVIRASARLAQLSEGLNNDQTEALVREAESVGGTVVMVEIHPVEGSGIVPLDWLAFFGPSGSHPGDASMVKGAVTPRLRDVRALAGTFRRDYGYEVFWVVFPRSTEGGARALPETMSEAELAVHIYNREGHVNWRIPR